MDTLIGIVGKDFTLLAADASAARSIIVFKSTEDKILQLDNSKIVRNHNNFLAGQLQARQQT